MIKRIKKYYYIVRFLVIFLLLMNSNLISSFASTVGWVIEGANIYVSVLDDNIVPPSGSITAFPNPCAIVSPATTCFATISWDTTNAPNACIFLKESGQMFACGSSGNSGAPRIDETGGTFELHAESEISSPVLASVLVKGEKIPIPQQQYTLTVVKSGEGNGVITGQGVNCGADCQETYKEGEQVTLTAIPDNNSNSIFKNWQGDCQGTINVCTLTMDSNKSATAVFEKNNRPPVINPIGNKSVKEGQVLSFNVSASDPDGDSLSYSASNLPSGATFVNGGFRWRPDYTRSRAEDYQVTFKAEDGKGGFDEETIAITVKDVEQPKHPPKVESLVLRDTDSHSRAYTNALKVRFVLRASDNGWVMYYFLTDDSSIIDGKTISADKPVRQTLPAGKAGFASQYSQSHKWIKVKYPSYGDVEIFSTFNLFPGTDGKREVRAFVKDRAGNVSAYKAASIILDTAKPVVTITTRPIANETTVTRFFLSGTASDALSGFKERAIEWKHKNVRGKASVSSDGSWSAKISELKAGDNVVTVTVVDKAGNKSEPATFTVKYNPSRRFVSKKAKYKW